MSRNRDDFKEYMRKLGISAAGSIPNSLLAEQDLESGKSYEPARDSEVNKLPQCKICGERATRMDYHMREAHPNNKSMELTLHTTKTMEKCAYCQGKVHTEEKCMHADDLSKCAYCKGKVHGKKKCQKCRGTGNAPHQTVKAVFEGTEMEDMELFEEYNGVEIMIGPELRDTDGKRIGCYLLMGQDGSWQAFFSLQDAREFVDAVYKAYQTAKSAVNGVFVPHEDILTELQMAHDLDAVTASCVLADVLESLGKGEVEQTGRELEDSVEEAKNADEPTDTLINNIKNIQIKRQKATILARERAQTEETSKGGFRGKWRKMQGLK